MYLRFKINPKLNSIQYYNTTEDILDSLLLSKLISRVYIDTYLLDKEVIYRVTPKLFCKNKLLKSKDILNLNAKTYYSEDKMRWEEIV